MNFNWLLAVIGLCGTIAVFRKKNIKLIQFLIPILLSELGFIVFSCLYVTVNHSRYMNTHVAVLPLLAVIGLAIIKKKTNRYLAIVGTIAVLFLSNYVTFDPLTNITFTKYNIGKTTMVTSEEMLSDSMVYNRQYTYFDKALDLGLKDVWNNQDAVIFFPAINGRGWFFGGKKADYSFWNTEKESRVYEASEGNIFYHYYITVETELDEILQNKVGYYFYLPFAGDDVADIIMEERTILEEKVYSYGGWNVYRIAFK